MALRLTLVTPKRKFFEDKEVDDILVPGFIGELNILEGHAPLVTTLNAGILKYKEKGESEYKKFAISWGYCEVGPQGVVVLAETAEAAEEIDLKRAETAREKSERMLLSQEISLEDIIKYQNKIRRSLVRIEVAQSASNNENSKSH